jgi:AraC family transcriptional regulator of adaptative response/methylated-DNA-[protein]-cysteine methyltransferase
MGMSPGHAQRVFAAWVGVSPKQFLGLLTVEHAKALLRGGEAGSVLDAALGRRPLRPVAAARPVLKVEAVTPGDYRSSGAGLEMRWGLHPTPFGEALFVASRPRPRPPRVPGRRHGGGRARRGPGRLAALGLQRGPGGDRSYAARAFANLGGGAPASIRLLVKGSPFQVQVWRALARIPVGTAVTYGGLARALGQPGAARAVGTACGRNRIGYLSPATA